MIYYERNKAANYCLQDHAFYMEIQERALDRIWQENRTEARYVDISAKVTGVPLLDLAFSATVRGVGSVRVLQKVERE